ncbi:MAG TPA: hypothetical protein VK518_25520 [Puia sp.]|nr:hypothetical protein [Puia sp.]
MTEVNIAMGRNSNHQSSRFNPVLRFLAHLVSYLFHPLFISSYVMAFLIFVHPYAFNGFDQRTKVFRFLNIVLCNLLFPAFSVFLLWRLKFIQSIFLHTVKERILPYIIAMIFYWWTWHLSENLSDIPASAIHFLLGSFLALCGAFMCNIYFKISMHMTAMGGALMFFFLFSFHDEYASGLYLSLALLATGLVGTARLIASDHSRFEIWSGIFVGMLSMVAGWYWPF